MTGALNAATTHLEPQVARARSIPVLLLLLGAAASLACGDAAPGPRDWVVITLDTTRADHLGLYGHFRDTSPNLDRLAEESLVFERYAVSMATTLPSHISLFTMTDIEVHGVFGNANERNRRYDVADELVPLAAWAASRGMQTAAFVSAVPLRSGSGVERGFTTFSHPDGVERPARDTTDAALAWLASHGDAAPFLLFVHYFDPHTPYRPPPEHAELFAPDDAVRAAMRERGASAEVATRLGNRIDVAAFLSGYEAEIHYMDAEIGRLLETLRDRERWDRTLVLVAGDHGESIGEAEMIGHGGVAAVQLRAPLLLRVPGVPARRVETVVSSADVLPTALAVAGVADAGEWLAQASGRNVMDVSGPSTGAVSRIADRIRDRSGLPLAHALTTQRWKYIRTDEGVERLYDLSADPYEKRDLAEAEPEVMARLRRQLEDALRGQRSRYAQLVKRSPAALDREAVEGLRALGYLGDDTPTETNP